MKSVVKCHGNPPFNLVLVHGGPGAPGSLGYLAKLLAKNHGVLEPWQSADSLEGQVTELAGVLRSRAEWPCVLLGHSWGAMLGFILTAHIPELVKKLILVGSGVFDESYASQIMDTRLMRLTPEERQEARELLAGLQGQSSPPAESLQRLGSLLDLADCLNPLPGSKATVDFQPHIFSRVWPQAQTMRASGELLKLGEFIKCPVVAIHGDYDPHPAQGVETPLKQVLSNFNFLLLKNCGHEPWRERQAKDSFLSILEAELT